MERDNEGKKISANFVPCDSPQVNEIENECGDVNDTQKSSQIHNIQLSSREGVSIMDVEEAIAYLTKRQENKEILGKNSEGEEMWVTFRIGHAGDASSLAALCKKRKGQSNKRRRNDDVNCAEGESKKECNSLREDKKAKLDKTVVETCASEDEHDSELEMRLSSGFGDEQIPPAFHAIIVEINSTKNDSAENRKKSKIQEKALNVNVLGGAAIVTLDWDACNSARVLRVELLKVDERYSSIVDLLMRRMLLRISALGILINATAVTFVDSFN